MRDGRRTARPRATASRGHSRPRRDGVEDEYFADANGDLALPEDDVRAATEEGLVDGGLALGGPGALLAALGRARTGRMVTSSPRSRRARPHHSKSAGRGLVGAGRSGNRQDGRGVARAAYLLFTHRATLERQGVLVVGPNHSS